MTLTGGTAKESATRGGGGGGGGRGSDWTIGVWSESDTVWSVFGDNRLKLSAGWNFKYVFTSRTVKF